MALNKPIYNKKKDVVEPGYTTTSASNGGVKSGGGSMYSTAMNGGTLAFNMRPNYLVDTVEGTHAVAAPDKTIEQLQKQTATAAKNNGNGSGGGGNGSGGGYYQYPTYVSPTAGASFSYGTAMPTWSWNRETPGDFVWDKEAPTYTSAYQDQINAMVDQILNSPAFSYDYNQDPLYAQYADAYTRNGNQAMNDTLAQVSARTGGLASSYAGTAAQQTYNRYMDALSDKIPELYQLAYSMYTDEGNNLRNNLNMIQGLENTDYGRYLDDLGQWNTDRNFAYNEYSDLWDRYYNDRNFDYGVYQDALGQWNTNRNFEYNKWADEISRQEAAARAAYNAQVDAYNAQYGGNNGGNNGGNANATTLNHVTKATSSPVVPLASNGSNAQTMAIKDDPDQYDYGVWKVGNELEYMGKRYGDRDSLFAAIASANVSDQNRYDTIKQMLNNGIITQAEYNELLGVSTKGKSGANR